MFDSLHQFYNSKEWSNLKESLLVNRENEDGEIICEHCGQPIMRDDIIFHHKEYLTVYNVNDFSISLNPDKIACVHFKCHNEIHDRWGKYNRHVYLVYGPPLSGKTSYVMSKATNNDVVIDMDIIRHAITGADMYQRSGYTDNDVFAVRDLLIDRVKTYKTKARNVFIIGGYPHARQREEMVKTLGAELVFMNVSKEDCLLRLQADSSRDRVNWTSYIDEWFFKYNYK